MDWKEVHFWAKTTKDGRPGISVRDHCLSVGCVAEALVNQLPKALQNLLPNGAVSLAALHDVGKISPGFQVKCPVWLIQSKLSDAARIENWANHEQDHARVSQWSIQKTFESSTLEGWSAVVGAHHGRIKGKHLGLVNIRPVGGPAWEKARAELIEDLTARFGPLPTASPANEAVLWLVAGLITVADWIGSDEDYFSPTGSQAEAVPNIARDAVQQIGWRPIQFRAGREFSQLFPRCAAPRPLQQAAVEHINSPGLYLIEAQMGSGKTEAALAAAYQLIVSRQACGLFFALPTQVTSNRIYERLAEFLAEADAEPDAQRLRLAHGASWLRAEETPPALRPAVPGDGESMEHVSAGRSWFASSKRALLATYGVGTVDQALLGIVAAKHFFVRQFGLAGKVVILDEIHTYDLYTGTLLKVLIRRLRELQCTVIILSATLTAARRRELIAATGTPSFQITDQYPLLTACVENQHAQEISFRPEPSQAVLVTTSGEPETAITENVLSHAQAGQCVLWVRNTVRQAQETFRLVQSLRCEGGPPVALLHSRFPHFRREALETDWLVRLGRDGTSRPRGCVLIATQVVEQSVDIDADFLVTDLAPTDMLWQRIGRLWRHQRPHRPTDTPAIAIHVPDSLMSLALEVASAADLKKALGPSARIYAPYVLLRSLEQWNGRAQVSLPDDIRPMLEATYSDRPDEHRSWRELRDELEAKKRKLCDEALAATKVWTQPELADREEVQTRYNSRPTSYLLLAQTLESTANGRYRVVLLDGVSIEVDDDDWSFPVAKAIHWNLVRVPRYAVERALSDAPEWLRLHVAGEIALGLVNDGIIFWPGQDQPSGLTWHPDEGVFIPVSATTRGKVPLSRDTEDDYESYD